MPSDGRCPVCQARFRGSTACSRCGADLKPLMLLVVEAWRARESARQALAAGDFAAALRHAARAQQLCATSRGRRLLALAQASAAPHSSP